MILMSSDAGNSPSTPSANGTANVEAFCVALPHPAPARVALVVRDGGRVRHLGTAHAEQHVRAGQVVHVVFERVVGAAGDVLGAARVVRVHADRLAVDCTVAQFAAV